MMEAELILAALKLPAALYLAVVFSFLALCVIQTMEYHQYLHSVGV